ncbi:hypothetical protein D9M71_672450 [compost metagenome]
MATALGADLVLDVHGSHAGLLERADGAGDVEGAAPAGVDVDQQRQGGGVGDAAGIDQHVFHGADAEVRNAQRVGRHAAAGDVQRLEAGGFGHARGIGGDRTSDLQRGLAGDGFTELLAGGLVAHDLPRCGVFLWVASWK